MQLKKRLFIIFSVRVKAPSRDASELSKDGSNEAQPIYNDIVTMSFLHLHCETPARKQGQYACKKADSHRIAAKMFLC